MRLVGLRSRCQHSVVVVRNDADDHRFIEDMDVAVGQLEGKIRGRPVQQVEDALLSTSMMPPGIPVGTLAIGKAGANNAALLAARILALSNPGLAKRLQAMRDADRKTTLDKDRVARERFGG